MDLCLSSGLLPQYAHDVLRAMAMPRGSHLQFRYKLKRLAEVIKEAIKGQQFEKRAAVIAYIDQSRKDGPVEIVPLRHASVIAAELHGTTVSLQLELNGFATSTEPAADFTERVRTVMKELPKGTVGSIEGLYWFDVGRSIIVGESEYGSTAPRKRITDVEAFESLVRQLSERKDFFHEVLFFHLSAIRDAVDGRLVRAQDGEFGLAANRPYDLQIHQLHSRDDARTSLELETKNPYLTITSNPTLRFTSPYDTRHVSVRSGAPPVSLDDAFAEPQERIKRANRAVLSIYRLREGTTTSVIERELDFDLAFRVHSDVSGTLKTGFLVGVLLAAPALLSFYGSGKWTGESGGGIAVLIVAVSLIGGLIASLGIRKPF